MPSEYYASVMRGGMCCGDICKVGFSCLWGERRRRAKGQDRRVCQQLPGVGIEPHDKEDFAERIIPIICLG